MSDTFEDYQRDAYFLLQRMRMPEWRRRQYLGIGLLSALDFQSVFNMTAVGLIVVRFPGTDILGGLMLAGSVAANTLASCVREVRDERFDGPRKRAYTDFLAIGHLYEETRDGPRIPATRPPLLVPPQKRDVTHLAPGLRLRFAV